MGAAYQATAILTDDESFGIILLLSDGTTPLNLADFNFEYEISGCGDGFSLKSGQGIGTSVDNDAKPILVIDPGADRRLRAGQYQHGLRATHIASGKVVQFFDGSVTVTEGNFR